MRDLVAPMHASPRLTTQRPRAVKLEDLVSY